MARGKVTVKSQNVVLVDVEDMVRIFKHVDRGLCSEYANCRECDSIRVLIDKILKANPWLEEKL